MSSIRCPDCGTPLSEPSEGQPCPVCLLAGALAFDPAAEAGEGEIVDSDLNDVDTKTIPCGRGGSDLERGERLRYLGNYEILEELGRGAMGVVYLAKQVNLGREVAVKVLLGGLWASEQARRRFLVEAQAAAALNHPAIVPIYEVGEHRGQLYFSMARVRGMNLAERLSEGPVEAKEAARWMIQIAEAVEVAHRAGVLHRDLKPSNVLLDQAGDPWVSDFGLAKVLNPDASGSPTLTGQILGTPGYIAPERLQGLDGPAGDIYSLGALLFALLVGEPLVPRAPTRGLLLALQAPPQSPAERRRGIPADLDAICRLCLEPEPTDRYPSAADLAADLRRFLGNEEVHARRLSPGQRLRRWLHRRGGRVSLVAAGLSILIASLWFISKGPLATDSKADLARAQALTALAAARESHLERDRPGAQDALAKASEAARRSPDPSSLQARIIREAVALWQTPTASPELSFSQAQAVGLSQAGDRLAFVRLRDGDLLSLEVVDVASGRVLEVAEEVRFEPHGIFGRGQGTPRHGSHPALSSSPDSIQVFLPGCGCIEEMTVPEEVAPSLSKLSWAFRDRSPAAGLGKQEGVFGPVGRFSKMYRFHGQDVELLPFAGKPIGFTSGGRLVFESQQVWELDLNTGERHLPQPATTTWAVSRDGGTALVQSPGESQAVGLWDRGRNQRLGSIPVPSGFADQATLSDDGSLLAILDAAGNLNLWQSKAAAYGRVTLRPLDGGTFSAPLATATGPQNASIAVAGQALGQDVVWVFETTTGRLLATLADQTRPIFGPLAHQLVTFGRLGDDHPAGGSDRGLVLWRLESPVSRYRTTGGDTPEGAARLEQLGSLEKGERLLTDRALWRRDSESGRWILEHRAMNCCSGMAPPVILVDAGGREWTAQSALSPKPLFDNLAPLPPTPGPSLSIFSKTPETEHGGESSAVISTEPLELYSTASPEGRSYPIAVEVVGSPPRLWAISELPPTRGDAPDSTGSVLEVWDLEHEARSLVLDRQDSLAALALSPDGSQVAVAGVFKRDGDSAVGVSLWSPDGNHVRDLAHAPSPGSLAWTADGSRLITGDGDGMLEWTDLLKGTTQRRRVSEARITAIAHDPISGKLAVADLEGRLLLTRLETDEGSLLLLAANSRASLSGSRGALHVTALAFAPEVEVLFSGDSRGEFRTWPLTDLYSFLSPLLDSP